MAESAPRAAAQWAYRTAGAAHEGAPVALAPPARIAAKNAVFSWLAALWRKLP
jgi:hypothetical protein